MKKGPYEVTESTHIYGNPWITVREDKVIRPDGTNGVFGVVDYAQGAHKPKNTLINELFKSKIS